MKNIFKHITAFVLAFMVLFSTFSFTVDMHYCGDTLVDTALFTKAESCGMQMDKIVENTTDQCSITKKDCCSEKQIVVTGQHDIKTDTFLFTPVTQLFLNAFVYTYVNRFEATVNQAVPFQNYIPPIVVKDIHKLDESYLI